MTIERQPSCDDPFDSLLPVTEARKAIAESVQPLNRTTRVSLHAARDRVVAETVVSPMNVPAQPNSAMDGYALAAQSIPQSGKAALDITGTAWAGVPYEGVVSAGQAVRIYTGAIMPEGADTVVIQEHVATQRQHDVEQVVIDSQVKAHRNVRLAGEDVQVGQPVMAAGQRLGAAEIGVLASLGLLHVTVTEKPREHHDKPLPAGKLFDSNRYTLSTLLDALNVEVIDLGVVKDNAAATRDALIAASTADLIITSGGISTGEADFVTRVFHELGEVGFWKLAMRPGRPLAFGRVGDAVFFGLPGNPVAVMVTFLQFVQPVIRRLQGQSQIEPLTLSARLESPVRKSAGRVEFQRGILQRASDGALVVKTTGKQGVQPFHGLFSL